MDVTFTLVVKDVPDRELAAAKLEPLIDSAMDWIRNFTGYAIQPVIRNGVR